MVRGDEPADDHLSTSGHRMIWGSEMTGNIQIGKRNNPALDAAKFAASVLVMLVHTPLFSKTGSLIWQFDALARMAVPFFAICSGYLFADKLEVADGYILKAANNNCRYLLCLRKIYAHISHGRWCICSFPYHGGYKPGSFPPWPLWLGEFRCLQMDRIFTFGTICISFIQ